VSGLAQQQPTFKSPPLKNQQEYLYRANEGVRRKCEGFELAERQTAKGIKADASTEAESASRKAAQGEVKSADGFQWNRSQGHWLAQPNGEPLARPVKAEEFGNVH
jgi:hypothetical protein